VAVVIFRALCSLAWMCLQQVLSNTGTPSWGPWKTVILVLFWLPSEKNCQRPAPGPGWLAERNGVAVLRLLLHLLVYEASFLEQLLFSDQERSYSLSLPPSHEHQVESIFLMSHSIRNWPLHDVPWIDQSKSYLCPGTGFCPKSSRHCCWWWVQVVWCCSLPKKRTVYFHRQERKKWGRCQGN
jgi:hypothetical protein